MSWLNALWIASRFVHFVSLFLLVTSSFFLLRLLPFTLITVLTPIWRYRQRQLLLLLALSSVGLVVGQLGMMGIDGAMLYQREVLSALLSTEIGQLLAWQIMVPLLALGFIAWLVGNPVRLLLFSLSLLLPLACLGHANALTGAIGLVQRLNQALHLVSVAYWSAGLLLVSSCLPYLRQTTLRPAMRQLLMRFSYYGHIAVVLTLASGVVSMLLISGFPYPLNHYGQLLTVKIIVVASMVAIALYNRYYLVPHLKTDNPAHRYQQRLSRNTWLAALLALVVICLVAIFATLPPSSPIPRSTSWL